MLPICETVLQGEIELMRHATDSVRFIVVHCSATRCNRPYTAEQLERGHRSRGFRTTGYHFYIRTDGTTTHPRLLGEVGAHVKGLNHCSIGICYEGGLDPDGHPVDTRTPRQRERLEELLTILRQLYRKLSSPAITTSPHMHPRRVLVLMPNGSTDGSDGALPARKRHENQSKYIMLICVLIELF